MKLFRVTFKVKPSPKHPAYWELQFGYLHLFLFDDHQPRAFERARVIVEQLPFENVGSHAVTYLDAEATGLGDESIDWIVMCIGQATRFGFHYFFEAWEVGTDEAPFINSPFPGFPVPPPV